MPEGLDHMKEMPPIAGGQGPEIPEGEIAGLRRRPEAFIYEFLVDPEVSALTAEQIVYHDFLWPYELRGADIMSYEVGPILNPILRRAGREALVDDLGRVLEEQNNETSNLNEVIANAEELGVSEEDKNDLWKHVLTLELQATRTLEIIRDRTRETQGGEWFRIFKETKAASKLERLYFQRIEYQPNITNWVKLFESPTLVNMYPSEMADVLATPDYGRATETAVEAILDVHLEGGFRKPDDETEFNETVDISADKDVLGAARELKASAKAQADSLREEGKRLPEELRELEEMVIDEERGVLVKLPISALKILQKRDHLSQRLTLLTAATKEHIGRMHPDLKDRDFVLKRAELLARHIAGATQLTAWLAVPRQKVGREGEPERWEIVYKKGRLPQFGSAIFEEAEGPNDAGVKLLLTRLKYWDEFGKFFPAGPPALAPALPESLSLPFFHDPAAASVYLDKELGVHPQRRGEENESILDAWYNRNKKRAEEGKDKKISISQVLRNVADGQFSYWVYRIWRQDQVLQTLRANVAGGREDNIAPLLLAESLRALNKAFTISFRGREVEGEILKVNMVAARIISWTEGPHDEIATPDQQMEERANKRYISNACEISGFLNGEGWKLVNKVVDRRRAVTFDELRKKKGMLKALIRRPKKERRLKERITAADVAMMVGEVAKADKLVEAFQKNLVGVELTDEVAVKKAYHTALAAV